MPAPSVALNRAKAVRPAPSASGIAITESTMIHASIEMPHIAPAGLHLACEIQYPTPNCSPQASGAPSTAYQSTGETGEAGCLDPDVRERHPHSDG